MPAPKNCEGNTSLLKQLFCCVSRLRQHDSEVIYGPQTSHIEVDQRNYETGVLIRRHSIKNGIYSRGNSQPAQNGSADNSKQNSSSSGRERREKIFEVPETAPARFGWTSNVLYRKGKGSNEKDFKDRRTRSASQLSNFPTFLSASSSSGLSKMAPPDFSDTNSVNLMYSQEHINDSNLKESLDETSCFQSSDRMFLARHPFQKSCKGPRPQTYGAPSDQNETALVSKQRPQSVVVVVQATNQVTSESQTSHASESSFPSLTQYTREVNLERAVTQFYDVNRDDYEYDANYDVTRHEYQSQFNAYEWSWNTPYVDYSSCLDLVAMENNVQTLVAREVAVENSLSSSDRMANDNNSQRRGDSKWTHNRNDTKMFHNVRPSEINEDCRPTTPIATHRLRRRKPVSPTRRPSPTERKLGEQSVNSNHNNPAGGSGSGNDSCSLKPTTMTVVEL